MPMVGYGAMVVESLLGIVSLVVVGAVAVNGTKPDGTPFAIFSSGVAGFLEKLGLPVQVATVFMTMCVSALALTSPGFRRTYRAYVLPGTVLRRHHRSGKNVTGAARADKQIFLPRSSPCSSAIC